MKNRERFFAGCLFLLSGFLSVCPGSTEPCGPWQWVHPQPSGNDLFDVTFTGEGFVAVGEYGTVLVSPDGQQWDADAPAGSAPLFGVAAGAGHLVAVGEAGVFVRSSGGDAWEPVPTGTDETLWAVAWGLDRFVAVGENGVVLSSFDGTSWELLEPIAAVRLRDIVYNGEMFLAVGYSVDQDGDQHNEPVVATSADGEHWSRSVLDTTCDGPTWCESQSLAGVAWADPWFVAVGSYYAIWGEWDSRGPLVLTSEDGSTWSTNLTVSPGSDRPFLWPDCVTRPYYSVAAGGGVLITAGSGGCLASAALGTDGTRQVSGAGHDLFGAAWGAGRFVVVGANGLILLSDDGTTWVTASNQRAVTLHGAASSGDGVVVVGDQGTVMAGGADREWQLVPAHSSAPLRDVLWTGGRYLAAGLTGTVRTSSDGVNWETQPAAPVELNGIASNGEVFVGVGYELGQYVSAGAIVTSSDARQWQVAATSERALSGVVWHDDRFVAVGNEVLSSRDGLEWVKEYELPANRLRAVASGGGVLVAVAWHLVLTNQAGTGWHEVEVSGDLHDVVWDGSRFIAVGEQALVLTSADGLEWAEEELSASSDLYAAAWTGTELYLAGEGGSVLRRSCQDAPSIEWPGAHVVVVPVLAHGAGKKDTEWLSDLVLHNPSSTSAAATRLYLMESDQDNQGTAPLALSVPPEGSVRLDDALAHLSTTATAGALLVGSERRMLVSSRTYNDTDEGTYGQFVPGVPISEVLHGSEAGILIQLAESDRYRTSFGLVNTAASPLEVELEAYDADGSVLGAVSIDVQPYGYSQEHGVFSDLDVGPVVDGWARVSSPTPGAAFTAWASVVDNQTGDPILVLPATRDGKGWRYGKRLPSAAPPGPDTQAIPPTGCGGWRRVVPLTRGSAITGVAIASHRWVAVGEDGLIMARDPGQPWRLLFHGDLPDLAQAVWTGERFVAVGADGTVVHSEDGLSWQLSVLPTGSDLRDLVWTGTQLVAVGSPGTVLTSPDGHAWEDRSPGLAVGLKAIAWNGSSLVAVGAYSVLTSTDGVTWAAQELWEWPDGPVLQDVLWSGGSFLVACEDGVLSSEDGLTWALDEVPDFWLTASIATGPSGLVAVGEYGSILFSADGSEWSSIPFEPLFGSFDLVGRPLLHRVVWTGAQYLAAGEWGTMLTSANGLDWQLETKNHFSLADIAWDGSQWIAVGPEVILGSADGEGWQILARPEQSWLGGVASNGTTTVAVGRSILVTDDGESWLEADQQVEAQLRSVEWGGDRFMAVGWWWANEPGTVATSPDGHSWEVQSIACQPRDITFDGTRWVLVGGSQAWISDDGLEWQGGELSEDADLEAVTAGNGLFVAVGGLGAVLTSSDGEEWARTESGQGNRTLFDVVWTGQEFVAVGEDLVMVSSDGAEWAVSTESPGSSFEAVAWNQRQLVAVGTDYDQLDHEGSAILVASCDPALEPLVADFSWQPTSLTAGQEAQFLDGSEGAPSRWSWSFGDGALSSLPEPAHVFTDEGRFPVSLEVEGVAGLSRATREVDVVGLEVPPPVMVVAAAAHTPGLAGTLWRTDLEVHNAGPAEAEYRITLLPRRQNNLSAPFQTFRLLPGLSAQYPDVVGDLFAAQGTGALRIEPGLGAELVVSSRTYNTTPEGTYGQFIAARRVSQGITTGQVGRLTQLEHNPDFRTNVGFANLGDGVITITVVLYDDAGVELGSLVVELPPHSFDQVNSAFARVTGRPISCGYASVRTDTPGGRFLAYASIVDNRTGDPIYLPVVAIDSEFEW